MESSAASMAGLEARASQGRARSRPAGRCWLTSGPDCSSHPEGRPQSQPTCPNLPSTLNREKVASAGETWIKQDACRSTLVPPLRKELGVRGCSLSSWPPALTGLLGSGCLSGKLVELLKLEVIILQLPGIL
ncbi:Solute Carrier Family 35 Member G1 [Manis pentadactyla]|nr:Solute Carrier Family 35 Member G1 [Manis pentadactyla]